MKSLPIAGLLSLASLGAQAQVAFPPQSISVLQPIVVTATRGLQPSSTLRDAVVLTREDIEAAGGLSLGELLERRAGIQLRATGGPGQPQGLFIRGAGTAQALVLVDGLRVGSATVGTTSIENIPLELIERIEVVKGPLSSLYGSEAIGGVVQIFTRGKAVPHLFVTSAYGTGNDQRVAAGIATAEKDTTLSLSMGARRVDAPSATNSRNFCFDPDRDPHANEFANLHASQRLWQGEVLALDVFATHGKTHFDGCPDSTGQRFDDTSSQTISGARFTSSTEFLPGWSSRIEVGQGRDRLLIRGAFPNRFETRQDQAAWINEFATPAGTLLAGAETVRQKVLNDESQGVFARTRRDTNSAFLGLNEGWQGQHLEASIRRDNDESFGKRTTGSASLGMDYPIVRISATFARGFRAPSFFDLYGPVSDFYQPNPALNPERSKNREFALRSVAGTAWQWRVTAFDNRIEDLITYVFPTVENVKRARIRGVEAALDTVWLGTRWRATATVQRPRDEDTGKRLQGRSERYASLEATRSFGKWSAGLSVLAAGDRYDSDDESPASRLPAYAVEDARVKYRFEKFWSVELAATNLGGKRYESAVGYDAPRRAVLLSVRFEAF